MTTYKVISNRLTATEISNLWNSYTLESMVHHIFVYFANSAKDKDIISHIEYDIHTSSRHLSNYIEIFQKENLQVPRGTTSEDYNAGAPNLFSDAFYAAYIKSLAKFALMSSVLAYTECTRDDVRKIFKEYINHLVPIDQKVTDILISKGINAVPPTVNVVDEVEFVENNNFFAGYFGEKRSLSVLEINQLFNNLYANMLGKVLLTGFVQVVRSSEIKEYFKQGMELSEKLIKTYSHKLLDEGVSLPPSLESEVLDFPGNESPFSDRLMLNHVVFLNTYGIGNKGLALAQSQRHDLSLMYSKAIVEIGLYANTGAELLIKNKWLEQPPIIRK